MLRAYLIRGGRLLWRESVAFLQAAESRSFSSCRSLLASSKMTDLNSRDHFVTAANEGRTIVCYHPERPFPYEHSRPVPRDEALLNQEDSLLKVQFRQDWIDETDKKNKELEFDQLARIFSQDKISFLPKPRLRRLRRYTRHSVERDGL